MHVKFFKQNPKRMHYVGVEIELFMVTIKPEEEISKYEDDLRDQIRVLYYFISKYLYRRNSIY